MQSDATTAKEYIEQLPEDPLPFINLASQKNHIAAYHMCMYSNQEMMDWFTNE